ncbi:MAG: VOC family protein [Pseudomonadota bacterium]
MTRTVKTDLIKPAHFAHFVLRCSNKEASAAFYAEVLGMEAVHENPMISFMTYDDEHHRIALVQTPYEGEVPKGAPGLDHVAYTLDSFDDLMSTYKRLKAKGIVPVWPINHGLTTSMYYADPDGNRVEFQVENFDTKEALQGYMRSEAFAANPIGVEYDPDEMLARYEAGEDVAALTAMPA